MTTLRIFLALVVVSLIALRGAAASPEGDAWQSRYRAAQALLVDGQFAAAGDALAGLAATADNPVDRAMAAELSRLARTWAARGGFVGRLCPCPGAPRSEGETPADRRTVGELASLYTGAVLYGIGSGVTLATYTEPDSPAAAILPTIGFAGAAALGVYALDRGTNLGYGVPAAITSGLLIGLEEGLLFSLWHETAVPADDEWGPRAVATVAWGAATVGAVTGGLVGAHLGTSPGRASLMHSAALWSAAIAGFATAAVTPEAGADQDNFSLLAATVGLNAGAVGGVLVGHAAAPSVGRVRFLDLGAIAGGLVAGGLTWAIGGEDVAMEPVLASLAGGIAGGIGVAWYLTRDMERDEPRRGRAAASRLVPTLAPTARGPGIVVGLAGAL